MFGSRDIILSPLAQRPLTHRDSENNGGGDYDAKHLGSLHCSSATEPILEALCFQTSNS